VSRKHRRNAKNVFIKQRQTLNKHKPKPTPQSRNKTSQKSSAATGHEKH
jgi:hypothetical protein